ncbi:MAG: M16 family metallopeptidase [Bacteroidales bacterium]
MNFETLILPNGIKLVHARIKSAVAYCGLTINAGSRDELEHEHGMAHFVEHTLFKGTEQRSSFKISTLLENEGGDLNAFTAKEETTIHAVVLKNNLRKAFDIIADIVFRPTFPEIELRKEKDIICDEINLYRDNPSEQIFDDFDESMFSNNSLGRSILGTPKSVRSFTRKKVQTFVQRCYGTKQMVLASIGNYSIDRVAILASKYFLYVAEHNTQTQRFPQSPYEIFNRRENTSHFQANCMLGNRSFSYYDNRRYTLNLLVNILGGPSQNSRLNLALREKHGLSYGVEASHIMYADSGVVSIYFGTDKNEVDKSLAIVHTELEKLRQNKLTEIELNRAKKQLLGQLIIASENSENLMLAAAKSMLIYERIIPQNETEELIQNITAEELQEMANFIFAPEVLSSLVYA